MQDNGGESATSMTGLTVCFHLTAINRPCNDRAIDHWTYKSKQPGAETAEVYVCILCQVNWEVSAWTHSHPANMVFRWCEQVGITAE